jgi:hypothetical protein
MGRERICRVVELAASGNPWERMAAINMLEGNEGALEFVALNSHHADSGLAALWRLSGNGEKLKSINANSSCPQVRLAASAMLHDDSGFMFALIAAGSAPGVSEAPEGCIHSCMGSREFREGLRQILENGG